MMSSTTSPHHRGMQPHAFPQNQTFSAVTRARAEYFVVALLDELATPALPVHRILASQSGLTAASVYVTLTLLPLK